MPWGGDVFHFGETSSVAFEMVRWALNEVDLVVPNGMVVARKVVSRFGVPAERVKSVSWGINRRLFRRAPEEDRRAFCARHGVDPASLIIVNARRFAPYWGSDLALAAFLRLAKEDATLHFFALGGLGTESFVAEARKHISTEGLNHRIRIFDGHIPDGVVQELISVADIFTSLVHPHDARSYSILEGAAAGATPVLSDVTEYREMERLGFRALFIERLDAEAVAFAVRRAIQDPAMRAEIAAANQQYLEEHEDNERNMLRLLDLIANCPVRREERTRQGTQDALAVIAEIISTRKYLGLVSVLMRLLRGCRHPLRSARSVWRKLQVLIHL
jgi:glycosyltransferase involved in cell wall biosynthesis